MYYVVSQQFPHVQIGKTVWEYSKHSLGSSNNCTTSLSVIILLQSKDSTIVIHAYFIIKRTLNSQIWLVHSFSSFVQSLITIARDYRGLSAGPSWSLHDVSLGALFKCLLSAVFKAHTVFSMQNPVRFGIQSILDKPYVLLSIKF